MNDKSNTPPYQEGFLVALIVLATAGLIWLFLPFLPALFFSLIVATATYQLFLKLQDRWKLTDTHAATLMSILIFFTVIAPITYLLVEISLRAGELYGSVQGWVDAQDTESLKKIYTDTAKKLPFNLGDQTALIAQIGENLNKLISVGKNTVIFLLRSVLGNTAGFLTFVFLSVFALFFFYRDGDDVARQIKVLSPLPNRYDEMLMVRFSSLATVLTISVVIVAVLQGLSFGILMSFMGLPGVVSWHWYCRYLIYPGCGLRPYLDTGSCLPLHSRRGMAGRPGSGMGSGGDGICDRQYSATGDDSEDLQGLA